MHPWEENRIRAAASSASIHKTLTDIEAILDGVQLPRASAKREELRNRLRAVLEEVARAWLQDGFRGGHSVASRSILDNGRIPATLSKSISRQLPGQLDATKITVRSALPTEVAERAKEWEASA